jgi:predicted neuraminidase
MTSRALSAAILIPGLAWGMTQGAPRAAHPGPSPVVKAEFVFEKAPFAQCHASTIAETRDGFVAAWFGGTAEGKPDVGIWLSRHDGRDWSAPVEVATGARDGSGRLPCWNPVLHHAAKGPLLLFYKIGPSPSRWWGMMATSLDGGRTWSASRRLPDTIIGPVKNHPLVLGDGTLLCGSSTENAGWRVHFERTADLGLTWERTDAINDGRGVGLIQPALLKTGERSVTALMRSTLGRIYSSRSSDGGLTWTAPVPTELPNPNSGIDALTLRDGRHLLVYNPVEHGRETLCLAVSNDAVRWLPVVSLENRPEKEYSYPAVIQSREGLVHVTYTWERTRIRHVVIDPSRFPSARKDGPA